MSLINKWHELVGFFCEILQKHPRLLCHESVSRDWVEEYLAFYALHGGLFLSFADGDISGVMTMHPGEKDSDFVWEQNNDSFTVAMLWAASKEALRNLMIQGFARVPAKKFFACRDGHVIELTPKKLTRLLKYGQKA